MLQIKENNIRLTRGDSAFIQLNLYYPDGNPVELEGNFKARFTVRKHPMYNNSTPPLIQKDFDNLIEIDPLDTQFMNYGDYLYDVQVIDDKGRVSTVCKGRFILDTEVGA